MTVMLPQPPCPAVSLTYGELGAVLVQEGKNVKRNLATLKAFQTWRQGHPHQLVGQELGANFADHLRCFLAWSAPHLAPGALANRKSALKAISRLAQRQTEARPSPPERPFAEAIRDAIARLKLGRWQATQRYGSVIGHWLYDDVRPSSATAALLQRIERDAELPPGSLTHYVRDRKMGRPLADFSAHHKPRRERHRALVGSPFVLRLSRASEQANPDLAALLAAWREFFDFQTRVHPHPFKRLGGWTANKRGVYASADRWLSTVGAFFGFLCLPPSSNPAFSGLGLPQAKLSFAMLGCWELWRRFIDFRHARSGGGQAFNSEVTYGLYVMQHLTRRGTGWLAQTEQHWLPELRAALSASGVSECDEHGVTTPLPDTVGPGYFVREHQKSRVWQQSAPKKCGMTRDPNDRLAPFLTVVSPMRSFILPLIGQLAADRLAYQGTEASLQFYAERRLMLIIAFFALPLRLLNWQLCAVGDGKPGDNLFRAADGRFRLHITREEMKNRKYLDDHYSIILPQWSQPYFAHYIDHVLPHIGPDQSSGVQWLLPMLDGAAMTEGGMAGVFAEIFARYFCYPIYPHAARHLVVTDLLKADPRNLPIAAIVLNDDIETVRKRYAHLLKQDLFIHFDRFSTEQARDTFNTFAWPQPPETPEPPKGRR